MKVLHCIGSMPVGGAERQLIMLAAAQQRAGVEVHVAYVRGGALVAELLDSGAVVHLIPSYGNYDPTVLLRIARLIHRERPDVIQTWLRQMDVIGGLATLATRTRWVLAERSIAAAYQANVKDRWLRSAVGSRAGAIVANSRDGVDYWRGRCRPSTILGYIPNAVPFDQIQEAKPADPPDVARGRRFVLVVGRLSAEKNLAVVIQAIELVLRDVDMALVICGEGPLRDDLATLIAKLGLGERVVFAGLRPDVWSLMKRAVAVVNASVFEGHPNVVLEAAAAGCPLVLSDIPAHRAVIDDISALFFAASSPGDLASAIVDVALQPEAAENRARHAALSVRGLSIERAVEQYQVVYSELVSRVR